MSMILEDGGRVGVIGAGPAGSFFAYFLLQLAERITIDINVDIYERRDFPTPGPVGCNMCAGVVSESLVQTLALEGINLPSSMVQRGIDGFVFHTANEDVQMNAPLSEMRIATVYRGSGPRTAQQGEVESFDGYLLRLAVEKGANYIQGRVEDVRWKNGRPQVQIKDQEPQTYDLIVGAVGVNSPSLSLFENLGIEYKRPKVRKTYIAELALGSEFISSSLGSAMHAFLLNIPGLEFGAIVPKGEYATLALIGDAIDREAIDAFVQHPAVRKCLPEEGVAATTVCRCSPMTSAGDASQPFADRVVMIGDCGISRLNKDGIGSAFRTARSAAVTAIFQGVSADDFRKYYWPVCQDISSDNRFGRTIYMIVSFIKKLPIAASAVVQMTKNEQNKKGRDRRMSMVLWDMFTGSAPYKDVFIRSLNPCFLWRMLGNLAGAFWPFGRNGR